MLEFFSKKPENAEGNELKSRTPPGQYLTTKFPVLTYGPTPRIDTENWQLRVFGEVEEELKFNYQEFMSLPQVKFKSDFHCVTTWSQLDNVWEGISTKEFMKNVKLNPEAKFVLLHCYGGYTTNLSLEAFNDDDTLFAHSHNGEPISAEHGWPLRFVIPQKYAWKSAKWINGIEFLTNDKLGFWERNGYNNNADPFKEERFW